MVARFLILCHRRHRRARRHRRRLLERNHSNFRPEYRTESLKPKPKSEINKNPIIEKEKSS